MSVASAERLNVDPQALATSWEALLPLTRLTVEEYFAKSKLDPNYDYVILTNRSKTIGQLMSDYYGGRMEGREHSQLGHELDKMERHHRGDIFSVYNDNELRLIRYFYKTAAAIKLQETLSERHAAAQIERLPQIEIPVDAHS